MGQEIKMEVGALPSLIRYRAERALVLTGSTREAEGAVMSGMNVVRLGETNGDEGLRSPNVDLLVDNVVSSLADLVGKELIRWLRGS